MKNRPSFFFLELSLSLIILTISMSIVFSVFSHTASINQANQAHYKMMETMINYSEDLRNPDGVTLLQLLKDSAVFTFNSKGELDSSADDYSLSISKTSSTINLIVYQKSHLVLKKQDGSIITEYDVSVVLESNNENQ